MKTMFTGLGSALLVAATAALTSSACGSDSSRVSAAAGAAAAGGERPSGAAGRAEEGEANAGQAGTLAEGGEGGAAGEAGVDPVDDALYALTTQIIGDQSQSYVILTPSLEGNRTLKIEDGVVEIAGRALGTGSEGGGALFVANDSDPAVTRYELMPSGRLEATSSVSFLSKGVTAFGEYGGQMQYISPEKAYWFDGPTAQIVIWNPSTMEVTGSMPLPGLAVAKLTLSFTAAPIRRGDKLYTFVAWRQGVSIIPRAAVVVVDSATDTATIAEDTRCGYVRDGVLADDGKLYVATEAFGAAAQFLDIRNPKPCLLRFDLESETFDREFEVELGSLFEGRAAGSLVVGPNNRAFLRVLDESSASAAALEGPRQLASSNSWGWARLSPGEQPEVEMLPAAGLGGGSVVTYELGNRKFAPRFVEANHTEFVELTAKGPAQGPGLTVPGLVFSAVKLR